MPRTRPVDADGDPVADYAAARRDPAARAAFDRLAPHRRDAAAFVFLVDVGFLRRIPFAHTPEASRYRAFYAGARAHDGASIGELEALTRGLQASGFFEAVCLREGNPLFTTGEAVPSFVLAATLDRLHPRDRDTIEPYRNTGVGHPVAWN